jgi:D-arabinose 1-dehydrogenase-like Zn-dependent alcohol dehydrogenase
LVKKERRPGLWLEEVPEPEVGINDVLIRVDRTGICGTDLHIYKWDAWAQATIPVPMVVGHEFVGEVVRVGANVKDFGAGDTVSAEGHVVCGRCRNCLAGRRHLCKGTRGIGVNRPGAFAEFISVPVTNVWHHDNGIDRDVAAIFDPFGNAVHTALVVSAVLGEDVLITGAGADRHQWPRRWSTPRRRPVCGGDGCERVPAWPGAKDGRHAGGEHQPRAQSQGGAGRAGDEGGIRRGAGDVGEPRGVEGHD